MRHAAAGWGQQHTKMYACNLSSPPSQYSLTQRLLKGSLTLVFKQQLNLNVVEYWISQAPKMYIAVTRA